MGRTAPLGLFRLESRDVVFGPAEGSSSLADRTDGGRSLNAVLSRVVFFSFGDIVKGFGTGFGEGSRDCGATAVPAAVCAFREGFDHRSLVGVVFLIDVDGKPLPEMGSSARTFFVLGPCDRFPIGAATQKRREKDRR